MLRESHGADIAIVVYASDDGEDDDLAYLGITNIQSNAAYRIDLGASDLTELLQMAIDMVNGRGRIIKETVDDAIQ